MNRCASHKVKFAVCVEALEIVDAVKPFREALSESVRDFGHDVIEARKF